MKPAKIQKSHRHPKEMGIKTIKENSLLMSPPQNRVSNP
jgi:hypothetical protein